MRALAHLRLFRACARLQALRAQFCFLDKTLTRICAHQLAAACRRLDPFRAIQWQTNIIKQTITSQQATLFLFAYSREFVISTMTRL